MKTHNRIKQWAALLGVITGMAALPLTVSAQSKVVNTATTVIESGTAYSANSTGTAALFVTGSGAVYNGTNITLSSTRASGNGRYAIMTTNLGAVSIAGGTLTSGITLSGTSTVNVSNVVISATNVTAVWVDVGSTFSATNFNITSAGNGVATRTNSATVLTTGTVTVAGTRMVQAEVSGGRLIINNATLNGTGSNTLGAVAGNGGYLELNNVELNCLALVGDTYASGAYASGTLIVNDSRINSSAMALAASVGDATVRLNNTSLTATGTNVAISLGYADVVISGGTINSTGGGDLLNVGADFNGPGGNTNVVFDNVDLSNAGGIVTGDGYYHTSTVTIIGGSCWNDDVTNSGSGSLIINLDDTSLTGNITGTNSGTTIINGGNGSTITGDITGSGSSNITVNLDNSTFTGLSVINDSGIINLTLNNSANWNLTGKSKLTTLTTNGGSITIANVQGEDLTVTDGISGQTALNLTLSDGVKGRQEIHVVVDETEAMNNDAFTLGNTVGTGMQTYGLENRLDGAWLVLGSGAGGGFSGGGDAVLNTAGAVSGFWFTQLDNLNKRMGELRYNAPSKGNLIENVWIRSYGQQANLNTGISGVKGFSETQYGVDLGTDKAWTLDQNNTLYTGVFAGYGGADRDFHSGYNGSTDSGYGGLYGTWINKDGWYADAVAKGQYFRNDFDGEDHAKYDSVGVGLSLELGRQFQFADGWFAEPSVQVSYLHLMNDSYSTNNGMAVDLNDSDVIQFYGGARFGRNIKLNQDGWLQPYVKVGGVEQISTGGQVRASNSEWRPTTDGARAVLGAGVVYQLDAQNQLHLDYEAAFGDKYDKPWGLNFGYRHQF